MVRNVNTHQWYFHYMSDILTTCIDLQWRYTILIFVLLYIARNAIFEHPFFETFFLFYGSITGGNLQSF